MSYQKKRIDVISMGCSKNLIDSEQLMKQLSAKGYSVFHDQEKPCGEYVVINTCGFIASAKEESINLILQLIDLKERKKIGKLVVMGCLSQRYLDELKAELPEVDIWYGKFDWKNLIASLPEIKSDSHQAKGWDRILTTPSHSAYLKISEGCNRHCAFCAIPIITGIHTSRPIDEILEEVKELVGRGVKEFNVIAQDLSSYGRDLYGENRLAALIESMAQVKGVEWIRLHYAYPKDFPMEVLDVMRKYDNVCNYLDIAFQHISDNILHRMRRHVSKEETLELIRNIREKVPGIKLRTTLMVGFPGETEKDFEELLEFIEEVKFERMGAFAYSEESDTYACLNYSDDIEEDIKQKRLEILMEKQSFISYRLQQSMIGQKIKVLIDSVSEREIIGRSEWDSPEVDPEVHINSSNVGVKEGDFVEVRITDATEFELYGEIEG